MKFTQFLFPDGRPMPIVIDMPADVEAMATELNTAGWSFEIEKHPDRTVIHMDCCQDDRQLANALVENGPEVPSAVEALVRRAHERFQQESTNGQEV